MALNIEQIAARVASLKYRSAERDARAGDILSVRQGKIAEVYPDFFPEGVDSNVVANFIDIVARDLSEVMAPLPAVNCSSASQVNDRARKFADNRTRIASNYFNHSDLQVHMYTGADYYVTYGFVPFIIEMDDEAKMPRIRVENPRMAYPEFDRYGRCISFAKVYSLTLGELAAQFPEYEVQLLGRSGFKQDTNTLIEIVRYYDKDQSLVYVPSRENLVLSRAKNPIGKMMVVIAKRPTVDGEMRGQFDDVIGIQLLRNRFAMLAMEAAEKSVQSPIVVPMDVQELQLGGDAVIRTNTPSGVRRVELTIPQGAFTEQNLLNQELRIGARYPEGRTGNVNASIVTGQGVQALMGAFDKVAAPAKSILYNIILYIGNRTFSNMKNTSKQQLIPNMMHIKPRNVTRQSLFFSSNVRNDIPRRSGLFSPIVGIGSPETILHHKADEILPTIDWKPSFIVDSTQGEINEPEKIGFIILRHVNSSITNEYWKECYRCIKKFYPKNRILIIDDNSDISFLTNEPLDNSMIIKSEFPKRGEFLP